MIPKTRTHCPSTGRSLASLGALLLLTTSACVTDPIANDPGGGKGDGAVERDHFIPTHTATATEAPDLIKVFGRDSATVVSINDEETVYPFVDDNAPAILIDALAGDDVITIDGDQHVLKIRGGDGDDQIRGAAWIIYGGPGADTIELTGLVDNAIVSGDAGDDLIRCGDDPFDAALYGGDGNDRIHGGAGGDYLFGGAGDDELRGHGGDDYLEGGEGSDSLSGGGGNDVIYGDESADSLSGGDGNDLLHGGPGDDTLSGDASDDALFGGAGKDELTGGAGRDALAGGRGSDTYFGGTGSDVIYHQADDIITPDAAQEADELVLVVLGPDEASEPGHTISVIDNPDGDIPASAAFRARVTRDLEALRSIPDGRALLAAIDDDGRRLRLTFAPTFAISNTSTPDVWEAAHQRESDRSPGMGEDGQPGTGALVEYQPHFHSDVNSGMWMPPLTQLYHELVHALNFAQGQTPRGLTPDANGVGTPNAELVAVGLPIDHDGDASTPRIQPNEHSENRLRRALRLPIRPTYY